MRRFIFSEAVVAVLAAAPAGVAPAWAQCAMCNTAAAGDVGRGLSISVLFLLTILAGVVGWFVVTVARSSRRDPRSGGPPPA